MNKTHFLLLMLPVATFLAGYGLGHQVKVEYHDAYLGAVYGKRRDSSTWMAIWGDHFGREYDYLKFGRDQSPEYRIKREELERLIKEENYERIDR